MALFNARTYLRFATLTYIREMEDGYEKKKSKANHLIQIIKNK